MASSYARPTGAPTSAADSTSPMVDVRLSEDAEIRPRGTNNPADDAAAAGGKPPFWTRRRKVFAAVCGGVTLVLLAVLIPVTLLVLMPKIAQDAINSSSLTFSSVNISDVTDASYTLSSRGRVENAGAFDADISFAGPVSVFWTDRPNGAADLKLGSMSLPGFSVSGSAPKSGNVDIPKAKFEIESLDAMSDFSKFLISQGGFSWRLKGSAEAKALGITLKGLSLDKVVKLPGFGGLTNVTISQFDLPESDLTKGININTKTIVQNPSVISIALGDLAFDSYVQGNKIGSLTSKGVTLSPGSNTLQLDGFLKAIDPKDVTTLGEVFSFYVGGKDTKLGVVGTSVNPPLGPCKWLSAGFVGLEMRVTLSPPSGAQQLVSGIKLDTISVTFNPSDPSGYNALSTAPNVGATFRSPFAFPLNIKEAAQDLTFVDPATSIPFARVRVPFTKAEADQKANKLTTGFSDAPLSSISGNEAQFQSFLKTLTIGDSYTFNVQGLVSANADTAGGLVTIANVSLTDSLTFQGLKGLQNVTVSKVAVRGGNPTDGILLDIDTVIENPSALGLTLNSDVTLTLSDSADQVLGNVVLPLMKLVPGTNKIAAKSYFKPAAGPATEAGKKVLSSFLQARDQQVKIVGSESSVVYTALKPAFSALSITSTLPSIKTPLVGGARLASIDLTPTPSLAKAVLKLTNPLDSPYSVTKLSSRVTYNGQPIGNIDQDLSSDPIVLAAGETRETKEIEMQLLVTREAIRALVVGLGGNLAVDIKATLSTLVGSYLTDIDYEQSGVKTTLG
ncbi:hypothetical protein HDU96_009295 [Phlyctochytrium bullatum]|nr:hypothetical protein HDU96_009295 [Phlyctochytrium bullatum]